MNMGGRRFLFRTLYNFRSVLNFLQCSTPHVYVEKYIKRVASDNTPGHAYSYTFTGSRCQKTETKSTARFLIYLLIISLHRREMLLFPKRRGRRRRSNIHRAKMLLHIKKHIAFTSLCEATSELLGGQEALGPWESRKDGRQEQMVTRKRLGQRSGIFNQSLIKLFSYAVSTPEKSDMMRCIVQGVSKVHVCKTGIRLRELTSKQECYSCQPGLWKICHLESSQADNPNNRQRSYDYIFEHILFKAAIPK